LIIFYIILAIVILLAMVTIHEFGHYVAGKLLGFKINEFSIGFGKSLYSKTNKSGEVFSLRLIPLGGYCAFEGEEYESEIITDENGKKKEIVKETTSDKAFNKQKPWKRLIVLFAGAFFNLLSAILFSIILLVTTGYDIPQIKQVDTLLYVTSTNILATDEVIAVDGVAIATPTNASSINSILASLDDAMPSSFEITFNREGEATPITETVTVAYNTNLSDLLTNDVVWAVNGVKIDFATDNLLTNLIANASGDTVTLTIDNDGVRREQVVSLLNYGLPDAETGEYARAIGVQVSAYKFTIWQALARCVPFTFGLAYKVLATLWMLVTGKLGLAAIGGPITTIETIATYTQANFSTFFVLLPLIAVNLGVFNLLPIPALDGSKMIFTTVEWIRKKPINPKIENKIHTIGLIVLFALVIIADIYHLIF
jgi:regulator of sigma E protease